MRFEPFLTAPEWHPVVRPLTSDTNVAGETPTPSSQTRMRGRSSLACTQSDALSLSIHDGGALHILAPAADLAAGRLDRLAYGVESS